MKFSPFYIVWALLFGCCFSGLSQEKDLVCTWKVNEDGTLSNQEVYRTLTEPVFSKKNQHEIWDFFLHLFPRDTVLHYFRSYHIESDGLDGNLAALESDPQLGKDKWLLVMDPEDAYTFDGALNKMELAHTFIHEFAHLITLNTGQLDPSMETSVDSFYVDGRYIVDEGVLFQQAYLTAFTREFWSTEALEVADKIDGSRWAFLADKRTARFFRNNKTQFVTEYAATNPVEDIAESFRYYICCPTPHEHPVVQQKIKFFDAYPELKALKQYVLKQLKQTGVAAQALEAHFWKMEEHYAH